MFIYGLSSSRGFSLATAFAVAACIGLAGTASATMITGSISSPPANSSTNPIDISAGTAAWAYYGYGGTTTGTFSPGNTANFTNLTGSPSLGIAPAGNSYVNLTFPSAPSGASTAFVYTWGTGASGSTWSYSLKTTLLAPSETLNLYLTSYNSASNLSATLSSGSGSFTDNAVVFAAPTGTSFNNNGSGQGHGYAVLSLAITGDRIGDVLTFTDVTNIAGVTGVSAPSGNVGIQAADVVVVPEPLTLGLLSVGGMGLLLFKRRRII